MEEIKQLLKENNTILKYINELKLTRLSDDFMINVLINQFNFIR